MSFNQIIGLLSYTVSLVIIRGVKHPFDTFFLSTVLFHCGCEMEPIVTSYALGKG